MITEPAASKEIGAKTGTALCERVAGRVCQVLSTKTQFSENGPKGGSVRIIVLLAVVAAAALGK
jgi:hypothetical protein